MINFTLDKNELTRLADAGFPKALDRALELTAREVTGNIGREAPVDEGSLHGSWHSKKLGFASYGIWSRVKYRWWVHEGTGIYGPHKRPIVPIRAKFLRFEIGGKIIFAKSVKGQKPNRYIDRAIKRTTGRLQGFVDRAIRETLV